LQVLSSASCAQRTPAGFPKGIPGIGDDMEGAMQHAPHPDLHSTRASANLRRVFFQALLDQIEQALVDTLCGDQKLPYNAVSWELTVCNKNWSAIFQRGTFAVVDRRVEVASIAVPGEGLLFSFLVVA
jgi:hypothetical protein